MSEMKKAEEVFDKWWEENRPPSTGNFFIDTCVQMASRLAFLQGYLAGKADGVKAVVEIIKTA